MIQKPLGGFGGEIPAIAGHELVAPGGEARAEGDGSRAAYPLGSYTQESAGVAACQRGDEVGPLPTGPAEPAPTNEAYEGMGLDVLTLPDEMQNSLMVAAAIGRVQELGGTLTEAEMRAVLTVAGWPTELHQEALTVSYCESRWSPYAVGDAGASRGLFQLWTGWALWHGVPVEALYDAVTNAEVALAVYGYDVERGSAPWSQWSCKA